MCWIPTHVFERSRTGNFNLTKKSFTSNLSKELKKKDLDISVNDSNPMSAVEIKVFINNQGLTYFFILNEKETRQASFDKKGRK